MRCGPLNHSTHFPAIQGVKKASLRSNPLISLTLDRQNYTYENLVTGLIFCRN